MTHTHMEAMSGGTRPNPHIRKQRKDALVRMNSGAQAASSVCVCVRRAPSASHSVSVFHTISHSVSVSPSHTHIYTQGNFHLDELIARGLLFATDCSALMLMEHRASEEIFTVSLVCTHNTHAHTETHTHTARVAHTHMRARSTALKQLLCVISRTGIVDQFC